MRGLSLKGIVIGNVANVVLAGAVTLLWIMASILFAAMGQNNFHQAIDGLGQSSLYMSVTTILVLTLTCTAAGYIAARVAKRNNILNGALGASGIALFSIFEAVHGSITATDEHIPPIIDALTSYSGPVFGGLGGYFATIRATRVATAGDPKTGGRVITMKVILRWVLSFPAAGAAYYAVVVPLGMLFKANGTTFIFAVAAAATVGTAVAPPQHRRAAGFVFIGLCIVFPIAKLLVDSIVGGPTHTDAFFILFNAVGAAFAYFGFQQTFPNAFRMGPNRWWWLAAAGLSPIERRARFRLWIVVICIVFPLFGILTWLGERLGVDAHFAAPAGMGVAAIMAILLARPIALALWAGLIKEADEKATLRLGTPQAG